MPQYHAAEGCMLLKDACPVMTVLLGFTVHCLSLLVHNHVLLGFMQTKQNLSAVWNVIEDTGVQTPLNLLKNVLLVISVQ